MLDKILEKLDCQKTIQLTEEEEKIILNSITKEDFIACGSSRAVYRLNDNYVVKVAMAQGGVNQNKIEVDFYDRFGDYGYFAHLYAYGTMINVMEALDDCAFYDEDDWGFYESDDADASESDSYFSMLDIASAVASLTGYDGADNGQIGYSNIRDAHVLYDYGYSDDYDRDEIVDSVGDWMPYVDPIQNALEVLETGELLDYESFDQKIRQTRQTKIKVNDDTRYYNEEGDFYD